MNSLIYFLVSMVIAYIITTLGIEKYGLQYTSIAIFLIIYGAYLSVFFYNYLERKNTKEKDNQQVEFWFNHIDREIPKIKQVNRLLLNPIYSHKRVGLYLQRDEYITKTLRTIMLNYREE
mgnify:CR=1 FL=1